MIKTTFQFPHKTLHPIKFQIKEIKTDGKTKTMMIIHKVDYLDYIAHVNKMLIAKVIVVLFQTVIVSVRPETNALHRPLIIPIQFSRQVHSFQFGQLLSQLHYTVCFAFLEFQQGIAFISKVIKSMTKFQKVMIIILQFQLI